METPLARYEEQYATSTAAFSVKMSKLGKVRSSEKRTLIEELKRQAEDLRELVGHMEVEVGADPILKPRVDSYKSDLVRLEKQLSDSSIKKKGLALNIFPDFGYIDFK